MKKHRSGVHWHARYCSPTIDFRLQKQRHGVKLPSCQGQGSDPTGFNKRTKHANFTFLSTHFKTSKGGRGGGYKVQKLDKKILSSVLSSNSKNINLEFFKVEELVKSYKKRARYNMLSGVTKRSFSFDGE